MEWYPPGRRPMWGGGSAGGYGERDERMVWPDAFSACLFGATALLAARALICSGPQPAAGAGPSPARAGTRMRRGLVAGLLIASLLRCLSLVAELAFENGSVRHLPPPLTALRRLDAAQLRWLRDLVVEAPALVFLSAFSVAVLFWAQLHYTTMIVPQPNLDFFVICVNLACYLLVAAVAVCTCLLKAYSHLLTYLICIIGFLNVVVAFSFLYYGLLVLRELAEASRKKLPGKQLALRMKVSMVCPAALLIRGSCYLAWGLSLGRPSVAVDLALCLLGEWFPSAVALAVLSPMQGGGGPKSPTADSLDDSTDSEVPLLHDDPQTPARNLTEAPGLTWKQLYPQPAPGAA